MARILALSSQVVRGHVGLSAATPALQGLGHEVWPVPTVIFSNHPGHPHAASLRIEPADQARLVAALADNGWLAEIDAVLTGYLPTPEHVHIAARIVRRLKGERSEVLYLCDPVLGDDPKGLYLDPHAATAIRNELIGLADILTPNRFELGWLGGGTGDTQTQIAQAARELSRRTVVVTSAVRRSDLLDNLLITPEGACQCEVVWRAGVPHGTGDFFSALYLGHRLNGRTDQDALARSAAAVELAILASEGRDELAIVASRAAWLTATPLDVRVSKASKTNCAPLEP